MDNLKKVELIMLGVVLGTLITGIFFLTIKWKMELKIITEQEINEFLKKDSKGYGKKTQCKICGNFGTYLPSLPKYSIDKQNVCNQCEIIWYKVTKIYKELSNK